MVSHTTDVAADTPHPMNHTAVFRRPGGLLDGPGWKVSRPDGRRSAKLLMNVTVQGSMGPVQVVMAAESKVAELIKAAVEAYRREKRRPLLKMSCEDDDAHSVFELHYSSFSLECLNLDEKLINLASRNFYLCAKPPCKRELTSSYQTKTTTNAKSQFPFAKLLDFLLEIFFRRETSSHMTDKLANRLYLMT